MPFTTQDQITAALPGQYFDFTKSAPAVPVAGGYQSLWDATGYPAAGSLTIGNTTTGVVPDDATLGAWVPNFVNAATTLHYGRLDAASSTIGVLTLYDRVWHAGSFSLAAAGNIAGWTGTTVVNRPNTNGDGVGAWVEVNVVLAATASTITITFTDQAGTTGRTATCALPASAAARRMFPFVFGQAGVTGIRSIQTINNGTAVATGSINIVLAYRHVSVPVVAASTGSTLDYLELGLTQVRDNSCIAGMWLANGAAVPTVQGTLNLITSP